MGALPLMGVKPLPPADTDMMAGRPGLPLKYLLDACGRCRSKVATNKHKARLL